MSTSARLGRGNAQPNAGDSNAEWTHDLHHINNPSASKGFKVAPRGPKSAHLNVRNTRLHAALNGSASSPALNSQFNILGTSKPTTGISIRGLAGPYLVAAKNLSLGTTAADVEAAMAPVGGPLLSCLIIAEKPKVIAEMVFETKEGADKVVETFNNQNVSSTQISAETLADTQTLKADGNILHVYHKSGAIPKAHDLSEYAQYNNSSNSHSSPSIPTGPRHDRPARSVTPVGPKADRYFPRPRSQDRSRRDVNQSNTSRSGSVVDGAYGFDEKMETDNDDGYDKNRGRGLYSDTIIGGGYGGNRGGNDRGRTRGNSWDRGRGGGNDRGRGYR